MNLENQLTVLVLNYNGIKWLEKCLPPLQGQGRVVVVENGSAEDPEPMLRRDFPWVELIRLHKNCFFAGAYNRAVPMVTTPYVALLSNDTEVAQSCMERLVSILEQDSTVGIAGPLIMNEDGSVQDVGSDLDWFGFPVAVRAEPEANSWEAFFCSGCLLTMRTADFIALGGFSEHFQCFVEDVDLCWKMRLIGKRVVVVPSAKMIHFGSGTIPGGWMHSRRQTSLARTYYRERNVTAAFLQNLGPGRLCLHLPPYCIAAMAEAFGLLLLGRWGAAREYARALRDVWGFRAKVREARRFIQGRRAVGDGAIGSFLHRRYRKLEIIMREGLPKFGT